MSKIKFICFFFSGVKLFLMLKVFLIFFGVFFGLRIESVLFIKFLIVFKNSGVVLCVVILSFFEKFIKIIGNLIKLFVC